MGSWEATASGSGAAWTTPIALVEQVAQGAAIDLLYVHMPFGAELETTEGSEAHQRFMGIAESTLFACLRELNAPFGIQRWPADDLVAWVAEPQDAGRRTRPGSLEIAVTTFLRDALRTADIPERIRSRLGELSLARVRLTLADGPDPLRAYARALRIAQREASDPVALELQRGVALIDHALRERAFLFHHQPIVDANAQQILAYEALCRGTLDELRFPDKIFSLAERTQRVWELGRVLRDLASESLCDDAAPPTSSLFVNVHPADIDDPCFLEQALSSSLADHAHRVVLELTERAAIRDYRRVKAFFATLRRHGYRLAIDDLGSGYAGLTSLAELEPDFIKFDMGLVRDLHLHPVKQRLIGRMHEFAIEIGAQTISEGVECAPERDALLGSGCTWMQGYFFARPAPGFCAVPSDRFDLVRPADQAQAPRSA